MKGYAAFGVKRFILCLGYKREVFIDYFLNYHARATDITVHLGKHRDITYHGGHGEENWEVTLADTGDRAMTGTRIARASKYLNESDREFFLTYGDAVADIDIDSLLKTHRCSGRDLTVTAVHPHGRFGEMTFDRTGLVMGFHEKPQTVEGFINGGFMVASRSMPDTYIDQDSDLFFEQEPMNKILKQKQMGAYPHEGFWQCMDTPREHAFLNQLWDRGHAPWTRCWR
jgi:glucose-1-phosphate cytidylyltransferase